MSTDGLSTSPDVVVSRNDRALSRRLLVIPAIVVGLVVLGIGMVVVRDGTVPGWERRIFHAINDLPDFLYRPLWPFQQLGALLVGPLVAIVALLFRRYRLAIALLIATVAKLVCERLVKVVSSRQRPGTSIGPDVHLRGDVSPVGESFVSGHAVLIAAIAGLVTPYLPGRWKIVPWVVVGLVMVTRVYVGAHNPMDVVCGAALGLAIAGLINLFLGPRAKDGAK
ncbi:MAG TPA: phosphatase PAP2 family protein [Ilumatobacteraceae bacterium]|nr:phosphatase PAP2 family protein [Ilumatobacteraceae bacterium]